jgi:hypothetical protein
MAPSNETVTVAVLVLVTTPAYTAATCPATGPVKVVPIWVHVTLLLDRPVG